MRDDSWRGGFLLAALEMYLKNDMRSKFHFLNDLEVRQKMYCAYTYLINLFVFPQGRPRIYFYHDDSDVLRYDDHRAPGLPQRFHSG